MTKHRDPEALLSAYLADGMEVLPDRVADAVLDEIRRTRQRTMFGPWTTQSMFKPSLAVAAAVAVLVAGALLTSRWDQPAIGNPSTSLPGVVAPSSTPSATPSPTPAPLIWTEASLKEDWPARVRAEPDGGAILLPILATRIADPEGCCLVDEPGRHIDPEGDPGSDVLPWVDIRELSVLGTYNLTITLVSNLPPDVDPTEQWIAYGVVFDDDRDGVPDRRFGMDNSPRTVEGHSQVRDWITDLHTGRTLVSINDYIGEINDGGVFLDVSYPGGGGRGANGANFMFGGDVAGGGTMGMSLVDRPFYAWASVIQDGRVVATDYAPDFGWLDLSVKTTLGSSPQVETTPGPTPQLEVDPDVPGGRRWTVTVVNSSPKPATLFVAEDTETGRGRLVGTVTPSVVPPRATVKVTFALPAKGSTGWAIFVNPDPTDTGPLLVWTDVPLAGEIRITADGNPGWLSP